MMAALGLVAAISTTALASTPAGSTASSEEPITIGVVIPLSGPLAGYGTAQEQALEIFEQAQAAGEDFGRPLRFEIVNDNSDPTQSTAAVREFAADPEVMGLMCCSSTALMLATYPVLTPLEIPTIFHSPNPYPEHNQTPFIYQVAAATYAEEAQVTLAFANSLGIAQEDVAFVLNNDASGQTGTEQLRAAGFTKIYNFPGTLTDYGPLMVELQNAGVQLIHTESNQGSSVHVINAQQAAGFDVPVVIGQSSVNRGLFESLGDELEGYHLITFPALVSEPELLEPEGLALEVTRLRTAFETYGGDIENIGLGSVAWDSALSFAVAADEAGEELTRESLNEAMSTQVRDGVFSPIERIPGEDAMGLAGTGDVLVTYEGGELIPVEGLEINVD